MCMHAAHACTIPGSGKTLIAGEVIRHRLRPLKQAGKAIIFLAPTNPLVAQVRA